jgi:putative ABC transport system permease protein
MLLDFFSLVFKDIKGRKFSSFLTFFAISLGILTIFVIVLVGQGFEQSVQQQFDQLGSNRIIIHFTGELRDGLTDNEVELIRNKPFIKDVEPHVIRRVQVEFQDETIQKMILGVPFEEEYFKNYNLEIKEGRFPRPVDRYGLFVGPEAAENLFQKEIQVGSNVYIKDTKFKVIGIPKSIGNQEDDRNIYISIDTLRDIYDLGDNVDMVFAIVEEGYNVSLAAENIEILLENKLGDDTVSVQTFEQLLKQANNILGIIQAALGGIALVSLIVGAVGIINTMFVIITEKTKEIGIMKAVGATNSNIFTIYVLEAGIFGFLGAVLGIILGGIGALSFGAWARANGFGFLEITIDPVVVLSLLLFGFGIGALSGFLPAYRASRLSIVDTFRK